MAHSAMIICYDAGRVPRIVKRYEQ